MLQKSQERLGRFPEVIKQGLLASLFPSYFIVTEQWDAGGCLF